MHFCLLKSILCFFNFPFLRRKCFKRERVHGRGERFLQRLHHHLVLFDEHDSLEGGGDDKGLQMLSVVHRIEDVRGRVRYVLFDDRFDVI